MSTMIKDGTGRGFLAKVNSSGQLIAQVESQSLQHHVSREHGKAFQVIGDFASVNNSTHTILHLNNTNSTEIMVVSYIRIQTAGLSGGTALPDTATRFELGFGRTISSGGTTVTPVVMNRTVGKTSGVTCTDNNPTMTGTFTEFDRWYVEGDGKMLSFNKEGSLILGKDDTLEIRIVSDHTSGTAYARVTFFLMDA